jgi:hypothetical protein
MSKLIITSVSELKTEKERSDKKVSRQFYTAYLRDTENLLTGSIQRNFFQDHNQDGTKAFWGKSLDYATAKASIGKEVSGEIVRLNVEPYDINGRMASSFTCLVLKNEDAATIAKQNGHTVVNSIASVQPVKETV